MANMTHEASAWSGSASQSDKSKKYTFNTGGKYVDKDIEFTVDASTVYNNGVSATKVGTAGAAQVLSGYTFTNASSVGASGTMTNQGAKTSSLNCGGSYTIPAGYHNGSGKITANSLASQTGVDSGKTAINASSVASGYQGWVNGNKISGTGSLLTDDDIYAIDKLETMADSFHIKGSTASMNADVIQLVVDEFKETETAMINKRLIPNQPYTGVRDLSSIIDTNVRLTHYEVYTHPTSSGTFTINCGFKPDIIHFTYYTNNAYGNGYYNKDISTTQAFIQNSAYTIGTNTAGRIITIDDNGFSMRAVGASNVKYWITAIKH